MKRFGRPAGSKELTDEGGAGYDLFAVLVHVGGTQGGHYYAYIRPGCGVGGQGGWVEFNDGDVRQVEEAVVVGCCGCDASAGMVKRYRLSRSFGFRLDLDGIRLDLKFRVLGVSQVPGLEVSGLGFRGWG